MGLVRGFGRFWWDFVVGDDPKIAVAVVTALAAGAVLTAAGVGVHGSLLAPLTAVGVAVAFVLGLLVDVRRHGR